MSRVRASAKWAVPFSILLGVSIHLGAGAGKLFAAAKPGTIPELALYQGADREEILVAGGKKEREVTLYTSHTWFNTLARAFEKKYPFIKVAVWRSDSPVVTKRLTEEYTAGRHVADVVDTLLGPLKLLHNEGIFQEYYSPEHRFYTDEVKTKGKAGGVYFVAERAVYNSLGFNTSLVSVADAPKTLKDLIDPKLKGKMSIAGSSTGSRWVGALLETMGREFLEKLTQQDIRIHNIAPVALAGLVVGGEVPLSPTLIDSNIFVAKQKGAPVEWRPLEPVLAYVGYAGLPKRAPHPHAALLFLDYVYSREGQELMMEGGLRSAREGIGAREFKTIDLDAKYPVEELERKLAEWEKLLHQLFLRGR